MATRREIIKIDEDKCNGCGLCVPACPEGALQIIDGKARLISDLFCDGLGACIGDCPEGAIIIEEREAEPYDEKKVMENIIKQGPNVIRAHLQHLLDHGETAYLSEAKCLLEERGIDLPPEPAESGRPGPAGGCPGMKSMQLGTADSGADAGEPTGRAVSRLGQWPVQIALVPPGAPYLKDARLVVVADCVPFAYANFHEDFLKDQSVLVGCPKLDDTDFYRRKFADTFRQAGLRSVEVVHMEVPCCTGLVRVVKLALEDAAATIPMTRTKISIRGEVIEKVEENAGDEG